MGSGITDENVENYFDKSHAAIIGSYFKREGYWGNELCEQRISTFMTKVIELRNK